MIILGLVALFDLFFCVLGQKEILAKCGLGVLVPEYRSGLDGLTGTFDKGKAVMKLIPSL
jgi:hypothetical protein